MTFSSINVTTQGHLTSMCVFYDSSHVSYIKSTFDLVDLSFPLAVFVLVWNIVLPVLTILGNMTVILTVLVHYDLCRVPSNILISSLAFSDLLTGIVLQSNNARGIYDGIRGRFTCNIIYANFVEAVGVLTITAGTANLAMITLDRYIAIVHSLRYTAIVTFSRVKLTVIVVWSFSFVFGIVLSVLSAPYKSIYSILRLIFYTYMLFVSVSVMVLYIRLKQISETHRQKIKQQIGNAHMLERRGLGTISMVMIALVISYIPYTTVRSIMRVRKVNSKILNVGRVLSFTFLLSHAMVNPFLYFFRSRNLRSYCYKMLRSVFQKLREKDVFSS